MEIEKASLLGRSICEIQQCEDTADVRINDLDIEFGSLDLCKNHAYELINSLQSFLNVNK